MFSYIDFFLYTVKKCLESNFTILYGDALYSYNLWLDYDIFTILYTSMD